jgi:hypothetical protein
MEPRITSFAPLAQVPSATLNTLQDRVEALVPGGVNNNLAATVANGDGRIWVANSIINTGTLRAIDNVVAPASWYDRWVWGTVLWFPAANERPGEAFDFELNTPAIVAPPLTFAGYLGTGGLDAAGNPPSAGNPPTNAAGPPRSYAIPVPYPPLVGAGWPVPAGYAWLYCDAATGLWLELYNDTGSNLLCALVLHSSGDLGKR